MPTDVLIRPARNARDLDQVHRLVHDVYLRAGYIAPQPGGRLKYCPHLDEAPETTIWLAEAEGKVVGTSTLTLDGPAGFHLDEEYPREAAEIRGEGRRLASSWRLAVSAGDDRVRVLIALFRANQEFLHAHAVRTCLFTLIPHFAPLYRKLFRATLVAAGDACESAPLAMFHCPTVLMRWDAERCPRRWAERRPYAV